MLRKFDSCISPLPKFKNINTMKEFYKSQERFRIIDGEIGNQNDFSIFYLKDRKGLYYITEISF